MWPKRPFWKSSYAASTSALVFITNGPAQASGSRIGLPPTRITSSAGDYLTVAADAQQDSRTPAPSTADCPIRIGWSSVPIVPCPDST